MQIIKLNILSENRFLAYMYVTCQMNNKNQKLGSNF